MTTTGELPIGTMHIGEKVLAYHPTTHKMELEPVLHVWINHDNDLVDLTLTSTTHAPHSVVTTTSEVLHTNKKHPFLTKEKGFLPVGQITLGMHVLRADGTYGMVTGWKIVPGAKTMYNLEVAQDHTYTVGTGEWVVHNCGTLPQQAEARARALGDSVATAKGAWSRKAITVGVAIVEDDNGVRGTLIAANEKASSSLVNVVKAEINAEAGEQLVSLTDNQGRHAEQVLVQYAQTNGLKILGLGASNNFCDGICGPMLIKEVGQKFLGQPWP